MPRDPYHYAVIARALTLIDDGGPALTLDDLAARMGMSTAHFQRVFSHWVGVSPKRYQQYLTLDHARRLLADRFSVLETSLATGLSGGGRLHDLFLRWEAMTPGEFARAGAGLQIDWGWFDSPFGPALVMGTGKGICGIAFAAETGEAAALDDLCARWPKADFRRAPDRLQGWADTAFGRTGSGEPALLHLIGAPFQIKVWEALLRIPTGQVTTYSALATAIDQPRAVRAVATAVGRNPVSWLIPCHRALRKSGGLGGYHWGLPVKRAMLAWEAARIDAA
jgi:AraC family transcriptional regulator of adaptative response/methylated-DNA-[protein]-cysteine methyltransferase